MTDSLLGTFLIELDALGMAQVILLGFIGGVLSGFIGSGGAFFMTPGMMNLGVPGPIAVASNITHKFGKALIGQKRHGEMGHVDKKLAIFMLLTAAAGISLAVFIINHLFKKGAAHEVSSDAASNLYISLVFVIVLTAVSLSMLRDILGARGVGESKPSRKIVDFLSKLRLHPMIHFPVADVAVSLWVVLVCGLGTGYLAGTIGVGGFVGVPAMIYVFGVSAPVAAGTELFLAMFMGAYGAISYGLQGMVDLRLTLLLFLGSLFGVHLGAYGTKVVREVFIRFATACIIILCVLSRGIAIPVYLRQLGYLTFDPAWDRYLNYASKGLLYASGIVGAGTILGFVMKAYLRRRKVQASLVAGRETGGTT
ncbi:MAG: sulfite exporter TauE/SafE family protein [Planctomycetota bacterium]